MAQWSDAPSGRARFRGFASASSSGPRHPWALPVNVGPWVRFPPPAPKILTKCFTGAPPPVIESRAQP